MAWSRKDTDQLERPRASATRQRRRGKGRSMEETRVKRERDKAPRRTVRVPGREDDLTRRTVPELRNLAARRDIPGRSRMNKPQLVRALRERV